MGVRTRCVRCIGTTSARASSRSAGVRAPSLSQRGRSSASGPLGLPHETKHCSRSGAPSRRAMGLRYALPRSPRRRTSVRVPAPRFPDLGRACRRALPVGLGRRRSCGARRQRRPMSSKRSGGLARHRLPPVSKGDPHGLLHQARRRQHLVGRPRRRRSARAAAPRRRRLARLRQQPRRPRRRLSHVPLRPARSGPNTRRRRPDHLLRR
jgi:hypothetical protein